MNRELKEAKQAIRGFMREHYTDERLAMLLAHLRDDKFSYTSCCCFIGIPTATHALRGCLEAGDFDDDRHYFTAQKLNGAASAEAGALDLGFEATSVFADDDDVRRRRLIPMVLAEMRRRERVGSSEAVTTQDAENVSPLSA